MHAELIAPRPLRITAPSFAHSHSSHTSSVIRQKPVVRLVSAPPTDAFAHISLADNNEACLPDKDRPASAFEDHDPLVTRRDASSPRLSPDALEEFLSILQPVVFHTPASPILRARYERSHPYKPRAHRRTRSSNSAASDDSPRTPERTLSSGTSKSSNGEDRDELGDEIMLNPRPWPYSSFLSSPISRMHTQNPLGRHVAHENDVPFQTAYFVRSAPSPVSPHAALALAQSVPIPPSPPAHTSPCVPPPHTMHL